MVFLQHQQNLVLHLGEEISTPAFGWLGVLRNSRHTAISHDGLAGYGGGKMVPNSKEYCMFKRSGALSLFLVFPTPGESWSQPPCVQWDYHWMVPSKAACLCHGWMGVRSEGKGQKGPEKGADQQELRCGLVSASCEILEEPDDCVAMQEGMGCPNKPQTVVNLLVSIQEESAINWLLIPEIFIQTCH